MQERLRRRRERLGHSVLPAIGLRQKNRRSGCGPRPLFGLLKQGMFESASVHQFRQQGHALKIGTIISHSPHRKYDCDCVGKGGRQITHQAIYGMINLAHACACRGGAGYTVKPMLRIYAMPQRL
jgi:hypothetical protein